MQANVFKNVLPVILSFTVSLSALAMEQGEQRFKQSSIQNKLHEAQDLPQHVQKNRTKKKRLKKKRRKPIKSHQTHLQRHQQCQDGSDMASYEPRSPRVQHRQHSQQKDCHQSRRHTINNYIQNGKEDKSSYSQDSNSAIEYIHSEDEECIQTQFTNSNIVLDDCAQEKAAQIQQLVDFDEKVYGAHFSDKNQCDQKLSANFSDIKVHGKSGKRLEWSESSWANTMIGGELSRIAWHDSTFSNVILKGNFTVIELDESFIEKTTFIGDFKDVNFIKTNIKLAFFHKVNFQASKPKRFYNFNDAALDTVLFKDCDLKDIRFKNTKLKNVIFIDSKVNVNTLAKALIWNGYKYTKLNKTSKEKLAQYLETHKNLDLHQWMMNNWQK